MNEFYNDRLDNIIASLPGIFNVTSNLDNKKTIEPIRIFFDVSSTNNTGLFFLTRCCDRRYWRYGHLWKIELSVGDMFNDNNLPITYMLHSGNVVEEESNIQAKNLITNMNWHLNAPTFMNAFNLKKEKFIKSYISYQRKLKLKIINNELY